jgi:hypothetical protein
LIAFEFGFYLAVVVFTNPGVAPYSLLAFNDVREEDPVDGLAYSNTLLSNCEVVELSLSQFGSNPTQFTVQASLTFVADLS